MSTPEGSSDSPPRRDGSRGGGTVHEGEFPSPAPPQWRIRMSQGRWAYSTGEDDDTYSRGVYRQPTGGGPWVDMAPLPLVRERLVRLDADGRETGSCYRLNKTDAPNAAGVLVSDDEIKTGEWAYRLGVPLSADDKIIKAAATALWHTGHTHAPARLLTPHWSETGELELPPADVGPGSYGTTSESEVDARDAWREITEIAARTPKLALMLGAGLGAVYLAPLRRQPWVLLQTGDGGKGKTTALQAAASMYGQPGGDGLPGVVKPMDVSSIGIVQKMAEFGVLPAFFDELGAAGLSPDKLEALVFRLTQGGQRTVGSKNGIARTSSGWRGVLFLSGNDSILGQVANEGVARRVIELETPITTTAADSDRLKEDLLPRGYGWPLRWLHEAGMDVNGFNELVTRAETDIHLPEGGVPRSLGRHLALTVAGAARLEQITATTGLREAALTAARDTLDQLVREITERGITPGQRVYRAVSEALASRPAAFPTRGQYRDALASTFGLTRDVEGWLLTDDDKAPGDLAVLANRLDRLCADAKITNPRTGVRELEKRGILLRSGETDAHLVRKLRAGDRVHRVYVFQLEDHSDTPTSADDITPDDSNTATPQSRDHGALSPETPASSDASEDGDDELLVYGYDGPVFLAPTRMGPCRLCGTGNLLTWDRYGPVHALCVQDIPGPAETSTAPATAPTEATTPASPAEQAHGEAEAPERSLSSSARPARRRRGKASRPAPVGVLDRDGLWLADADTPTPVQLPADVEAAYRLASAHELRQLWIHPRVHGELGIPETREISAKVGPATAVEHAWAMSDTLRLDPAGLAAWVNVGPPSGDGRRIGLVFPAYDWNRTAWHTASDGPTLRDAVLRFAALTGEPFYMSSNETSAAMIRRTAGDDLTVYGKDETPPEPIGTRGMHLTDWSRALTDDEDGCTWAHSYDLNAAEASVNTSIYIGVGAPTRANLGCFDRKAWKTTAGYVRANIPRTHPNLDPRLPDLAEPWHQADRRSREPGGPAWVPAELLVLLDELGVPIETHEALYWSTSRRLMRPYGERISKARLALVNADADDEAARVALRALKGMYQSRIGDCNRPGSRIYRPDIRDMIKAKAVANGYRSLGKIAQATGRYPIAWHVDAALFTSDDPNPETAAPQLRNNGKPVGMQLGPAMGQWKTEPDKTLPLAKIRDYLGEPGFERKVARVREGRR